mmetsp:Transcript_20832/g.36941  ORF Transcript_20832/g.36941 Transcript_20832/m.36941 type:complete len:539 (+) Transcript_20832:72-1688(+)
MLRDVARRLSRNGVGKGSVTTQELLAAYRECQKGNSFEPQQTFSTREIFANTEVHMDKIKVIGFDYDFTLAAYKTELQRLIYSAARDHLVEHKRYPKKLRNTEFDKQFAVRGLTFDKTRGLLFKLGPNFKVDLSSVFKGRQRLEHSEALDAFGGTSHMQRSNTLVGIFDQFSLAEACLLADVCEFFFSNEISFSPAALYQDISSSISNVHTSGVMHGAVMNNTSKYLHKSPKLRKLLTEFREGGVETFVMSNSSFDYIDRGMRYLCGDDWLELFDVVMTDTQKPSFFSSKNPFRQIDLGTSPASSRRIKWSEVTKLEPGSAYSKGNVDDLMRMTGWQGDQVLYVGDHIFADLRRPARNHGWWTAAIVHELETEIKKQATPEYQSVAFRIQMLEEILRRVQWAPSTTDPNFDLMGLLDELEQERIQLRREMNDMFNPNFGSVFTAAANNTSLFSSSLERYVDLYTSRLENFLDYGPGNKYRFYPRRKRLLAHEPPVVSVASKLEDKLKKNISRGDVMLRQEHSFMLDDDEDDAKAGSST